MKAFVIRRVHNETSTSSTPLERRRQKIRAIHGKAIMGYSPTEDLYKQAENVVSIECLSCRRAFLYDLSDSACETKKTQGPCLGYERMESH